EARLLLDRRGGRGLVSGLALDQVLDGHAAFLADLGEPEPALERRRRALGRLRDLGLPTRRHEAWRYTDVRHLAKDGFAAAPGAERATVAPSALDRFTYWEDGAARLVLVDGHFRPELSRLDGLPAGVELTSIRERLAAGDAEVLAALGATFDEEDRAFALLNSAWLAGGAVLRVGAGTRLERPVHLLHLTSGAVPAHIASIRHLVLVERGAECRVVERFASLAEGAPTGTNVVTEARVADGAALEHLRVQREGRGTTHLGVLAATLGRDARLRSVQLGVGARLGRNEVVVRLEGGNAEAELFGLSLARGEAHLDTQVRVEHAASHARSRQTFRSIVADAASAVFNGAIRVPADVAGSDAEQSSANLLLSARAAVYTKPQLEIDAEDVRCSHGARSAPSIATSSSTSAAAVSRGAGARDPHRGLRRRDRRRGHRARHRRAPAGLPPRVAPRRGGRRGSGAMNRELTAPTAPAPSIPRPVARTSPRWPRR
ncbi:MAG: SufD family Fe-S cluster assembly protein, partial [Planctomycetota bacterium]